MAINAINAKLNLEPCNKERHSLMNNTFSALHRLQSDGIGILAIGLSGIRVTEVRPWPKARGNKILRIFKR